MPDSEVKVPEDLRDFREEASIALEASKDFFEDDELHHVLFEGQHIPIHDAVARLLERTEALLALRQTVEGMAEALRRIIASSKQIHVSDFDTSGFDTDLNMGRATLAAYRLMLQQAIKNGSQVQAGNGSSVNV